MTTEEIEFYTQLHRQCQLRGLLHFLRDYLAILTVLIAVSAAAHRAFGLVGRFLVWREPSTLKTAYWIAMGLAALVGAIGLYLGYDTVVCYEIGDGLELCGLVVPLTPCHTP